MSCMIGCSKKINLSFGSTGIENLDVTKRMFLVLMVPVIQKVLQISLLQFLPRDAMLARY